MPRRTRKELQRKADCALRLLDNLDAYLMEMDLLAADRQPAISAMRQTILQGTEILRSLWQRLRKAL